MKTEIENEILNEMKRYNCVCGGFGVGKTNLVLNLAVKCAALGKKVTVVDLDTVNPFFRSSNYVDELKKYNIKIISPCEFSSIESPALSAEIYSCFDSVDADGIYFFDIGGDSTGARVIGMFADRITEGENYTDMYVVNSRRPQVNTVERCVKNLREIEQASHIKVTSLVCNTHLLDETTADIVLNDNLPFDLEDATNMPVAFACVPLFALNECLASNLRVLPVKRYNRLV